MTITPRTLIAAIACAGTLGGGVGALATAAQQSAASVPARASLVTSSMHYCGNAPGGAANFVLAAGTSCSTARAIYAGARCTPGGNACSSHGFGCISDSLANQLSELYCTRGGALILSQTF